MPIRHFYFQGEMTGIFSLKMQKRNRRWLLTGANAFETVQYETVSAHFVSLWSDMFQVGSLGAGAGRRREEQPCCTPGNRSDRSPAAATRRDPVRIEHEHTRIGGEGGGGCAGWRGGGEGQGGAAGRGRPEAGAVVRCCRPGEFPWGSPGSCAGGGPTGHGSRAAWPFPAPVLQ